MCRLREALAAKRDDVDIEIEVCKLENELVLALFKKHDQSRYVSDPMKLVDQLTTTFIDRQFAGPKPAEPADPGQRV